MIGISYISFGNNNTMLSIITRTGLVHQTTTTKTNKKVTDTGLGGEDLSADYRNKLGKSMTKMIKKHPILGNGYGVLLTDIGQTESRCEYMYLDIWMEMGIVGLGVFVALFIIIFAKWIKIKKNSPNSSDIYLLDAIMVSLIGSLVNTGLNPFFNNPLGITFTIFAVCAVNVYGKEK
jgi:O-antigen ligase